jgi:hypothetical protein
MLLIAMVINSVVSIKMQCFFFSGGMQGYAYHVSKPSVRSIFGAFEDGPDRGGPSSKPLKMDLTEGSETSAKLNLTRGENPKENTQDSEHGETLKSRNLKQITK